MAWALLRILRSGPASQDCRRSGCTARRCLCCHRPAQKTQPDAPPSFDISASLPKCLKSWRTRRARVCEHSFTALADFGFYEERIIVTAKIKFLQKPSCTPCRKAKAFLEK